MDDSSGTTVARISVRVILHADLRRFLPQGMRSPLTVELSPPASVADLLEELEVPAGETLTVGLNGELGGRESRLSGGDEVTLFGPMEGG